MQERESEHAPREAQRGKGRRKAALHLLLLLGGPCLVLSSVFLTGAYWGSSRVPKWLLEKEASWFGWSASPKLLEAAQRIENRRNGLGMAMSAVTSSQAEGTKPGKPVPAPPKAAAPEIPAPEQVKPVAPAKRPPTQPTSLPKDSTLPAQLVQVPKTPDVAPAVPKEAAPKPSEQGLPPENKAGSSESELALPTLDPAHPARSKKLQTAKDRFDLPAKVGVMLVVDAQAFPGSDSCGRARSALHAANIKYRAWLNLSLDVRGCLPWVAKSDQKKARGQALAALDLPGTDLLLVLTRPGRIDLPALGVERDVFNLGLSLAPVPGGADDAGVSRALMHALGLALGAEPIEDAQSPDARRGSVMNAQPQARRDWLDEPNRWRMLERKQWPFARRNQALGGQ